MDRKPKPKGTTLGVKLPPPKEDDEPLHTIIASKTPVSLFLANGVKLNGIVVWTDHRSLILRGDRDQWVLIRNIATVCPDAGIFFI